MDKGQCEELTIRRMPEGGYVVIRGGRDGYISEPLFACSDIGAALGFIEDQIVPVVSQASKR